MTLTQVLWKIGVSSPAGPAPIWWTRSVQTSKPRWVSLPPRVTKSRICGELLFVFLDSISSVRYRFGNITTMEWWNYLYLNEGSLYIRLAMLHLLIFINRICNLGRCLLLYISNSSYEYYARWARSSYLVCLS